MGTTQQQSESSEQPHDGSVPRSAPIIIAMAQPVPDVTVTASLGQFLAHAPHSMQASRSTTFALRFSMRKTPWGQTDTHMLHPLHMASFRDSVTAFCRYRRPNIMLLQTFIAQGR